MNNHHATDEQFPDTLYCLNRTPQMAVLSRASAAEVESGKWNSERTAVRGKTVSATPGDCRKIQPRNTGTLVGVMVTDGTVVEDMDVRVEPEATDAKAVPGSGETADGVSK